MLGDTFYEIIDVRFQGLTSFYYKKRNFLASAPSFSGEKIIVCAILIIH